MSELQNLEKEYEDLRTDFLSYRWGTEILYELEEKMKNVNFDLEEFVKAKKDEFWKKTVPISEKITNKNIQIGKMRLKIFAEKSGT